MGKKHGIIIILGILSVSCFVLGLIGLMQYRTVNNQENNIEYKIKYTYYVDDEEVKVFPTNTDKNNPDYIFNRYSCTNRVIGEWDEANWKFVPKVTNTATCKLYFNRAHYNVKFEIEYGELKNIDGSVMTDEERQNGLTAEREKNLIAKIQPNEGYSLVSVECDKKNVTDWDKENNELTIKAVKADTKCVVKFALSNYEVDVKVSNGTGGTTLTIEHGKSVNITVTPNNNYGTPEIKCSNNQKGVWSNNKFTIEKVEKETSCTVEFKISTYNITVNVSNGTSTPSKHTVNYNGSKDFKITADPGYTITYGYGVTECADGTLKYANGELTLSVNNVVSDTTCNVTLKAQPVSEE